MLFIQQYTHICYSIHTIEAIATFVAVTLRKTTSIIFDIFRFIQCDSDENLRQSHFLRTLLLFAANNIYVLCNPAQEFQFSL